MKPSSQYIVFLFTVTIEIEPNNSEITFNSLKGNRKVDYIAAQYIPSLFTTNQEQYSDSMPIELIDGV